MEKGIQIGEKRYQEKWQRKGETTLLTRLLQHRFGDMPTWT